MRLRRFLRSGIRRGHLVLCTMLVACIFQPFSCTLTARAQGNVGIGTTSPDASALLDLTSTSRGFLIPRMTEAQKNAIASPATGLLIYETDNATTGAYAGQGPTFWYYDGITWVPMLGGGWLLTGNGGTSASTNFIGTKDSVDWTIRTNNTERVRVYAAGNVALTNSNNTAEELRFLEPSSSGTNYTGFKAGVMSSSVTYTWPLSDGNGTNYVLCTDGFGTLSWRGFGSAGGGGADTLWRRGGGKDALEGIGVSNTASGDYAMAAGYHDLASGVFSVALGAFSRATDSGATVSGGEFDTASGKYSVVGGGLSNSATAAYSFVGGGQHNSACGQYSVVAGGNNNTACGDYSVVLGGNHNNASGDFDCVFGVGANVTQDSSVVFYNSGGLKLAIGGTTPSEVLDVTGNIKFTGALMPNNNAGTSGYVLASTGSSTAPVWTSTSNLYWSTLGNTGTTSTSNFLGTIDAKDFVLRTNNTERMRILSTGQVAVNTVTTTHQFHSLYIGTTTETGAVFGNANAATSNQAIGVWGAATNTSTSNTGTIGVLGTGNGNATAGQTNIALQINDGEFTMGRTTETPGTGSVVEGATSHTAWSAQGPSGVIELTLGGGNLTTVAPTAGVYQDLGSVTINNRYTSASSIIFANILAKTDDGVMPDAKLGEYLVDVESRGTGSFVIRIGLIPTTSSASNYTTSDKIRIGYTIINPAR